MHEIIIYYFLLKLTQLMTKHFLTTVIMVFAIFYSQKSSGTNAPSWHIPLIQEKVSSIPTSFYKDFINPIASLHQEKTVTCPTLSVSNVECTGGSNWKFTINGTGFNPGTYYLLSPSGGVSSQYIDYNNPSKTFWVSTIAPITIIVSDAISGAICGSTLTVNSPCGNAATVCNISATANAACQNQGSANAADDTWTITVNATGGASSSYFTATANGISESGPYGSPKTLYMGNISNYTPGSTVSITIADGLDPSCSIYKTVTVPQSCSVACPTSWSAANGSSVNVTCLSGGKIRVCYNVPNSGGYAWAVSYKDSQGSLHGTPLRSGPATTGASYCDDILISNLENPNTVIIWMMLSGINNEGCPIDLVGTVNCPPPNCNFSVTPNISHVTCSSLGTVQLIPSGGTAPFSYTLSYPSGLESINSTGTFTGLQAGVYSAVMTDANGCTKTVGSFNVNNNTTPPTVSITPNNPTICQGSSTTLQANATGAYAFSTLSYLWPNNSAATTSAVTVSTAGTYTVIVKDNSNGCTTSTSANVTVNTCCDNVTSGGQIAANQTGCSPYTANMLTSIAPASGGSGVLEYVWLCTTNFDASNPTGANGLPTCNPATGALNLKNWVEIPNSNSTTLNPGTLTETKYYLRCSRRVGCPCFAGESNIITITIVKNVISGGEIAANQTGCAPFDAAVLTSVAPATGGTGTIEYQWFCSTTGANGPFNPIAGATNLTYDPPASTVTKWYRRCARVTGCTSWVGETNVITITVTGPCCDNVTSGGQIAANQTGCSPYTANILTSVTPASGGSGVLEYMWLCTTNFDASNPSGANGLPTCNPATGDLNMKNWVAIPNSNSETLNPGTLTETKYYLRCSRRVGCPCFVGESNIVKITIVKNVISGGEIAANQTGCSPFDAAVLTSVTPASGGTGTIEYQWFCSTTGANGPFNPIAGATNLTYDPPASTVTKWYRRCARVTGCTSWVGETNVITITVTGSCCDNVTSGGQIAANQTGCSPYTANILTSVAPASGGSGVLEYVWLCTTNYDASNPSGANGLPTCNPATGALNLKNWVEIPNSNSTTLNPGTLTETKYYLRCSRRVGCPCFSGESNVVTITVVKNVISGGEIAANQTGCAPFDAAILTSVAPATGGTGTIEYQWFCSTTGANGPFNPIAGATNLTYDPPASTVTKWYRRCARVTGCTSWVGETNVITIAVTGPCCDNVTSGGQIAANQTGCSPYTANILTSVAPASGGSGVLEYVWLCTTNFDASNPSGVNGLPTCNSATGALNLKNWIAIPNSNSETLNPGTLTETKYYLRCSRRVGCPCFAGESNIVKITVVKNVISGGEIAANQTGCSPFDAALLTSVTPATGGTGTIEYQWFCSTTGANGSFSPIAGATGLTYDPPTSTVTKWYRRCARIAGCTSWVGETNVITITVTGPCCDNVTSGGQIAANQTGCSPYTANILTSVTPASGGSGVLEYVWLCTTNFDASNPSGANGLPTCNPATGTLNLKNWVEIPNSNSTTLNPGTLTETKYYLRCSRRVGCPCFAGESNIVKITVVKNVIAGGEIAANQTGCAPFDAAVLTSVAPAIGGTGTIEYQWFCSTTGANGPFSPIAGATGLTYNPPASTVTKWYRRCARIAGCTSWVGETNVITITVTDPCCDNVTSGGQIAANQTGCSPYTANMLTSVTPASGGSGVLEYVWLCTTNFDASNPTGANGLPTCNPVTGALNLKNWVEIPNSNSTTLNPGTLTETKYYLRCSRRVGCPCFAGESNIVKITVVKNVISGGEIAANQTGCSPFDAAVLTSVSPATGGTGNIEYQWFCSTTGANGPFTPITGATSLTYDPTASTVTKWYRRCARIAGCTSWVGETNVITVTVTGPCCDNVTSGGQIAANQTGCSPYTANMLTSIAPASGGSGVLEYVWLCTTNFDASNPTGANGLPTCNPATGALNLKNWVEIPNSNSTTLNPGTLTETKYYLRCSRRVGCPCFVGESNIVKITVVKNVISGGEIAANQTGCSPFDAAVLTSVAPATGGTGTIEYQWFCSTTGANGPFNPIANATDLTYDPPASTVTKWYRRCARVTGCTSWVGETNIVVVTVTGSCCDNVTSGGQIAANQTGCSPYTANILTSVTPASGGSGVLEYMWLCTTNFDASNPSGANGLPTCNPATGALNMKNWVNIPNSNSQTLNPGTLAETKYYLRCSRRVGCPCFSGESNVVTITVVKNVISGGEIAANQTGCSPFDAATLTSVTPASGGTGTIEYQWFCSTTGANGPFTPIAGATNLTYDPPASTATKWYRRCARVTGCTSWVGETNVITVTVTGPCCDNVTSGGQIAANQTGCSPYTANLLTSVTPASGGSGVLEYVWLCTTNFDASNPSGVNGLPTCNPATGALNLKSWVEIPNSNSTTLNPGTLTETKYYLRCSRRVGCPCFAGESNVVTITVVKNVISGGEIAANQTGCAPFDAAVLTSVAPATGGTGTIEYQWFCSTTGANGPFNPIAGATNLTYDPPASTVTKWYRRCARIAGCTSWVGETNVITITVTGPCCDNVTSGGQIAANQTGCSPFDAALLTSVTPASGGTGTIEYQWFCSTVRANGPFTPITGATSLTYDPPASTVTKWYRRCARITGCNSWVGESNVITIKVSGALNTPIITCVGGTNYCPNNNINVAIANPIVGAIYTWNFGATANPQNGSGTNTFVKFPACGTYTITVTVTKNNCVNTATKTIQVVDYIKPVITCPADKTINCNDNRLPSNTGKATATDNCTPTANITITYSDVLNANSFSNCLNANILRIWTAKDLCGNTATCQQRITVADNIKPIFSGVPANVTVECNEIPSVGTPTATDNCDTNVDITYKQSRLNGSCADGYKLIRAWTATDDCGNKAYTSQVICVQDTKAPILTVPANATLDCGQSIPPQGQATATDNCDTYVTIEKGPMAYIDPAPGGCGTSGVIYTWIATDNCGNKSTKSQTILVKDMSGPVLSPKPADITVNCSWLPTIPNVIAKDACNPTANIPVTFSTSKSVSNGKYIIKRTWKASDACGNISVYTQTICATDMTKPTLTGVPANVTVQCSAPPKPNVKATDNCDSDVELNCTETSVTGICPIKYTLTRVWTAKDDAGNIRTASQVVVVKDDIKPIIHGVPADVTLNCGVPLPTPTVYATDNCDVTVATSLSEIYDTNNSSCPNDPATILCTWIATDACGNQAIAYWHIKYANPNSTSRQQATNNLTIDAQINPRNNVQQEVQTNNATLINSVIKMFPNPTTGEVTLSFDGTTVSKVALFDVTNRLIYETDNIDNDYLKLDLTNTQKGVYHVQIHTEKGIVTKRLLLME
jgi:hypothetical protein